MKLSAFRENEIKEVLEYTKSGGENMAVFKHLSPSLIRLWLDECIQEIEMLRAAAQEKSK